ncbi:hypothetical protein GP486_004681 [Trichoglossum hirsutum]|uniref:Uncharacterized protein n=1 Tax=Trichoglossum hirsutum TaxID=265104 RepID=A0A9P8LAL0_9PEZI|nr:hypothetical protein GP486_004681 [Trichoglossum hirsutum]
MSTYNFDSVLSALSRDGSLDEGWREVKVSEESRARYRSQAELVTIWDTLKDLYWSGVERDIATAILALADTEQLQPDALPVEDKDTSDTDLIDPFPDEVTAKTREDVEKGVGQWFRFKSITSLHRFYIGGARKASA